MGEISHEGFLSGSSQAAFWQKVHRALVQEESFLTESQCSRRKWRLMTFPLSEENGNQTSQKCHSEPEFVQIRLRSRTSVSKPWALSRVSCQSSNSNWLEKWAHERMSALEKLILYKTVCLVCTLESSTSLALDQLCLGYTVSKRR